jgi:hypothetical protein
MKAGDITKWYVKPGQFLPAYSLFCDVKPDALVAVSVGKDDDDNNMELHIEIQDEMYLAKVFGEPGHTYVAGSPLAILCEYEEDIGQAKMIQLPPSIDVYEQLEYPVALWQAFIKKVET